MKEELAALRTDFYAAREDEEEDIEDTNGINQIQNDDEDNTDFAVV